MRQRFNRILCHCGVLALNIVSFVINGGLASDKFRPAVRDFDN